MNLKLIFFLNAYFLLKISCAKGRKQPLFNSRFVKIFY
jgi:hypothetical protein